MQKVELNTIQLGVLNINNHAGIPLGEAPDR